MNHSVSEITGADCCSPATIRMFLQQAVDHYPRLVAFSFTLTLPYRKSMTDYRALILRFHTEVWQQIGKYSWQRQQERRSSPPTLLRWIWEAASAPECKMVLLLNPDTLGRVHDESAQQGISEMLIDAWIAVTGANRKDVTNITPVILNRVARGVFTTPFNQFTAQVKAMTVPVTLARTSVICA